MSEDIARSTDVLGSRGSPYLVEGLDVSDQDAQVLSAEVHIVVHVLVEALIRPGVSRGENRRLETASPSICLTSLPALGCPLQAQVSVRLKPVWLQSNQNSSPAKPLDLKQYISLPSLQQALLRPLMSFPFPHVAAPTNHHQMQCTPQSLHCVKINNPPQNIF